MSFPLLAALVKATCLVVGIELFLITPYVNRQPQECQLFLNIEKNSYFPLQNVLTNNYLSNQITIVNYDNNLLK